jgi:hypothetical protein
MHSHVTRFWESAHHPADSFSFFSVKAGHLLATHVRDLRGVIEREKAEIGVLISMQPPTKPMLKEAAEAGFDQVPCAIDTRASKFSAWPNFWTASASSIRGSPPTLPSRKPQGEKSSGGADAAGRR